MMTDDTASVPIDHIGSAFLLLTDFRCCQEGFEMHITEYSMVELEYGIKMCQMIIGTMSLDNDNSLASLNY